VTVNVSPLQVMAPGFDITVARVLEATGTDPDSVFLEVTESAFLEDGPRALTMLEKTREVGVGLILDDFGTGYSSLSYLRRFPFDVLKIDQVFVDNLASSDSTRKIVAAIIDLAHGLDMAVVTEGIETHDQLTQVRDLGTDRVQGFYLCRPLLADQVEKRILEPAATAPVRLPLSPSATFPSPRRPPPG
jgi:EAL domain-containing protein (putative c-di-GMP-specific phosphodiesterase class I)